MNGMDFAELLTDESILQLSRYVEIWRSEIRWFVTRVHGQSLLKVRSYVNTTFIPRDFLRLVVFEGSSAFMDLESLCSIIGPNCDHGILVELDVRGLVC